MGGVARRHPGLTRMLPERQRVQEEDRLVHDESVGQLIEEATKRKWNRRQILKRAAAYFARENVLPKESSRWSVNSPTTASPLR